MIQYIKTRNLPDIVNTNEVDTEANYRNYKILFSRGRQEQNEEIRENVVTSEVINSIIFYAAESGVNMTLVRILKYCDTADPSHTPKINVTEKDYESAKRCLF